MYSWYLLENIGVLSREASSLENPLRRGPLYSITCLETVTSHERTTYMTVLTHVAGGIQFQYSMQIGRSNNRTEE